MVGVLTGCGFDPRNLQNIVLCYDEFIGVYIER
jgi:hypothetical protein